jgi:hypothetical protein
MHSEDGIKLQDAMFQEIIILIEYVSKKYCLCDIKTRTQHYRVCGCGNDWRMVVPSLDGRYVCKNIKEEKVLLFFDIAEWSMTSAFDKL